MIVKRERGQQGVESVTIHVCQRECIQHKHLHVPRGHLGRLHRLNHTMLVWLLRPDSDCAALEWKDAADECEHQRGCNESLTPCVFACLQQFKAQKPPPSAHDVLCRQLAARHERQLDRPTTSSTLDDRDAHSALVKHRVAHRAVCCHDRLLVLVEHKLLLNTI